MPSTGLCLRVPTAGSENREVSAFLEAGQHHDTSMIPWPVQVCEVDDCKVGFVRGVRGLAGKAETY